MTSDVEKLTKLHLQAFGLTDYIIKELVKSLDVQCKNAGFNEYAAADIRASVEKKVEKS
ncbi:MAG: hypothetical protein HC812_20005 [Leptolyngbya sp. RL_3_1]|nr:hypothetical protein [Leptolyngbya sp. RL_3_1]